VQCSAVQCTRNPQARSRRAESASASAAIPIRGHTNERSAALFAPSLVTSGTTSYINATVRNSLVATPPRTPLVQCIEARALAFQGGAASLRGKNVPLQLERLKVQKYGVGGRYEWHYDWAGGRARADRWGSWMVWLKGEGEGVRGGGTEFPRLRRPGGREWCRFIECEGEDGVGVEDENGKRGEKEWEPAGKMRADGRVGERYEDNGSGRWRGEELGVTFKPIAGNAVFWVNLREDGSGWEETWHKGCEVVEGEKVGLNIWSWVVY
jgi:prolyl 4-hydroxylase